MRMTTEIVFLAEIMSLLRSKRLQRYENLLNGSINLKWSNYSRNSTNELLQLEVLRNS